MWSSDTITDGSGNDLLSGQNNDDSILGGEGDDSLYGGKGTNRLDEARAATLSGLRRCQRHADGELVFDGARHRHAVEY